ncbi:1-acyl-sn-glycerol-3-phosphate acyltransferase beta-like isoform X1 [Anopheles arabiensis]|uniref:1-acylglycerol-3-phosphate O-acyltransferase n=1 Tax=Anopheles arabiensis TaxID=7173 RepID=A0A3F2YSS4_ANOAR|nr:1-acyl-sn-glycerol-3-phosphate acyltransferase beta-like isoform X1 [Anopheles arabiensis]
MAGCFLCSLGWIVRYYLYACAACFGIFVLLTVLSKLGERGNKIKYYSKYGMIYFATQSFTTLFAPFSLLRPRNIDNCRIIATVIARASKLLGITWELRNAQILRQAKGAIVLTNHQSSMDILGMMILWDILRKVVPIAKLELLFLFPFGPTAWLAGVQYINRKNRPSAMKSFDRCKRMLTEDGAKMYIYPEGTRYPERGMLPFKKGAFHTAIEAQVPIVPVVFSHMYFIQSKRHIFDDGHVIIDTLEPIPTAGLTKADLDQLIERTRTAMLARYEELNREVDDGLKSVQWVNRDRPRFTVYEGKKTN